MMYLTLLGKEVCVTYCSGEEGWVSGTLIANNDDGSVVVETPSGRLYIPNPLMIFESL